MEAEEIQAQVEAGVDAAKLPVGSKSNEMTLRERWRRTMFFQKLDSIPNFEFGYWESTLPRWHEQGLPPEIESEARAYEYFGIEHWQTAWINVMGLLPPFEHKVIKETEARHVWRGRHAAVRRKQSMTSNKINPRGKRFAIHTGRTVANVNDDKGCRTKLAAEVDVQTLMDNYHCDLFGWHRVTCYGDHRKACLNLARLYGLEDPRRGPSGVTYDLLGGSSGGCLPWRPHGECILH